ncbi:MAG: hypothetical protein ACTSU5_11560 [Promethearchaeota archaeon]
MVNLPDDEQMDLVKLAEEIREKRALPYNLIVEKVEGNRVVARNNWGSHLEYEIDGEHFKLVSPIEPEQGGGDDPGSGEPA